MGAKLTGYLINWRGCKFLLHKSSRKSPKITCNEPTTEKTRNERLSWMRLGRILWIWVSLTNPRNDTYQVLEHRECTLNNIFFNSGVQARIEWVLLEFLVVFHWIDPPKNSQSFVEKAYYPDATPLKISIRTHSIPACWCIILTVNQ